jgi:Acetyltransferase (GNAT) domain
MTIVLRGVTREAAEAILAGERPGDVRVADDCPTEFSAGPARALGAERQFGSFLLHRSEDGLVVGEIGAAFSDEVGTLEIGYAVVESQPDRGYATAAVEALVARAREASEVRRIVAPTPLDRPQSGRVVEKAAWRCCGRRMMWTKSEASCASRSASWRSGSAAHREPRGVRPWAGIARLRFARGPARSRAACVRILRAVTPEEWLADAAEALEARAPEVGWRQTVERNFWCKDVATRTTHLPQTFTVSSAIAVRVTLDGEPFELRAARIELTDSAWRQHVCPHVWTGESCRPRP